MCDYIYIHVIYNIVQWILQFKASLIYLPKAWQPKTRHGEDVALEVFVFGVDVCLRTARPPSLEYAQYTFAALFTMELIFRFCAAGANDERDPLGPHLAPHPLSKESLVAED